MVSAREKKKEHKNMGLGRGMAVNLNRMAKEGGIEKMAFNKGSSHVNTEEKVFQIKRAANAKSIR